MSLDLAPSVAELLPSPMHEAVLGRAISRAIRGATKGERLTEAGARDLTRRCLRLFAELAGTDVGGMPWTFGKVCDHLEEALRLDLAGGHFQAPTRTAWARGGETRREHLDLATGEATQVPHILAP